MKEHLILVNPFLVIFSVLTVTTLSSLAMDESSHPDVLSIPADLENPAIISGEPAPGKMVLQSLPAHVGNGLAHAIYLPTDWVEGKRFPVMVEYLGNHGRIRDNKNIGYALSGGKGFIWVVLPFVSADGKGDMDLWWGDTKATVAYAKEAVPSICRRWGGDPTKVILVGYSRGAIACNYIGLHDDEIAKLWRAVIAVSHYDDAHTAWGMPRDVQARAPERLRRLGKTPQFICGEYSSLSSKGTSSLLESIRHGNLTTFSTAKSELGLKPITELEGTRKFIAQHHPEGKFTILDLPWVNHDTKVLHRDTPARKSIRGWIEQVLRNKPDE